MLRVQAELSLSVNVQGADHTNAAQAAAEHLKAQVAALSVDQLLAMVDIEIIHDDDRANSPYKKDESEAPSTFWGSLYLQELG